MLVFRSPLSAICSIFFALSFFACELDVQQVSTNLSNSSNMTTSLIPLEDFFRNPERTQYKLSPDGSQWAYLGPYEDRQNLFVQAVTGDTAKRITAVTDRDISSFFWANNESIIYIRDQAGDENYQLYLRSTDGKTQRDLTPYPNVKVSIIDHLPDDPDHIIIGMNKRDPKAFDAYRLNIHSAALQQIAENPGNITNWLTDHDGKLRVAIATDGVNNQLLYRDNESEDFRLVRSLNFRQTLYPLFFDFDNGTEAYALSNLHRDKNAIVKIDLTTGEELEMLFEHEDVDAGYLAYSRKRKVLTSIFYTTWKRQYQFLDEEVKAIYAFLEEALPNKEIVLSSTNEDEDAFIVRTYSDRSLGSYYYYQKENNELRKIADVSPWLQEEALCSVKPIRYNTRDGLEIHGYLTLPHTSAAKNLPVVVHPHGGPWARDNWGFSPVVQFLANRGYAVLQMNFRGSTGYGQAFQEASYGEWGLRMQDDITDGVKWLIEEGIADPNRIGIFGGSYGGYATLAGVTFTPDLYACGIDYVGVSNLFTFMESIPPYWEPYREMLYEMVGNPDKEQDSIRLQKTSPLFHVEQIKAPLLIAQGAKDPRVKQSESDQIVAALRERGVEVQYLLKENEGHGFSNQENRFELYRAMEDFLAKHLAKPL